MLVIEASGFARTVRAATMACTRASVWAQRGLAIPFVCHLLQAGFHRVSILSAENRRAVTWDEAIPIASREGNTGVSHPVRHVVRPPGLRPEACLASPAGARLGL